MATGISATDEKVPVEPYSPTSTFVSSSPKVSSPNDLKVAGNYDVEAAELRPPIRTKVWRWLNFREPTEVDETEKIITRRLEDCASGYPRTAAFMSSERNFSLYRDFSDLHSRVLLDIQDRIVVLERELHKKDERDTDKDTRQGSNRLTSRKRDEFEARSDGDRRPRRVILNEIRERLLEYDELLVKVRELASFQRPSERDYISVRNWFRMTQPLVQKEQEFLRHKEELLTLSTGREWCGFDGFVESILKKLDCKLIQWLFLTQELRDKTTTKEIHYYSKKRVEKLIGIIITAIIFTLLILPVIAMYKLTEIGGISSNSQSTFNAVGVLVTFTLLFSAAMSLLTKAQRHELFAASAAYCAVLVVFISNLNGGIGSGNSMTSVSH